MSFLIGKIYHREDCEGGFMPALAGQLPEVASFAQREVVLEDSTGFATAIGVARKWLAAGLVDRCVVGGVDSLVQQAVLEAIARRDLLKGPERPSGLAPGEAAAFVVVEPPDRARRAKRPSLLSIDAVAEQREPKDARSSVGFNGGALASVLAAVVPSASVPRLFLGDLDGTTSRAQDWGSAMARRPRLVDGAVERYPAEVFGAIGSAEGPVALCLAAEGFRRGTAPGSEAVIWLWSELGSRAALLVRAPERT
jgi:3-oxoacyl-[acyl-carrier-protein] synthase-1